MPDITRHSYPNVTATHWEGCWRDPAHHACAVTKVERLMHVCDLRADWQDRAEAAEAALATARREALEEAAKSCEARISIPDSHNAPYNAEDMACAEAIRALKDRPAEDRKP